MSQRRTYPFTTKDKEKMSEVQSYIVNNLHLRLSITALSKMAGMNREKFQQGFRDMYGLTVAAYIHKSRMLTAKFLLLHTDKTIKEIAALSGYHHVQNFNIAYKNFHRITPGAVQRTK